MSQWESSTTTWDAIEFLSDQHRQMEALWSRLAGGTIGTSRNDASRELVKLLSQHDAIELQLLYPELRTQARQTGEQLADHSLDEHRQIRRLLADIDGQDMDDPRMFSKLDQCITLVRQHAREEEQVVFPLLRQHCDAARLRDLGARMADMMSKAPTHPHPTTPDSKLGATIAGAVTGVVDRARDAIKGERQ